MGLTIFHVIFLDIPRIQFECGEYPGILCGIVLVPQNIIMDLNNVMHAYKPVDKKYLSFLFRLKISVF